MSVAPVFAGKIEFSEYGRFSCVKIIEFFATHRRG